MDYEPVIGLEVHAQLLTRSKIFCGCSTAFGGEPNAHTCPVCTGQPGSLPVVNGKAVEFAIKMALACQCTISPFCLFARKNYFYPDLPKGYQISQYEYPLAKDGYLEIPENGGGKRIGIIRIHMEEDAGKLVHRGAFESSAWSLVDFNRTGVPLIEIVSGPDLRTPQEAGLYLRGLRDILRYLGICDGDMEKGSFRCDANVSVRPVGQRDFGVRAELKNMNSFRHVERALEYEITRQIGLLEAGEEVVQETRLWNEEEGRTLPMRGKEEAHDYRYFPDPDLVPLEISETWIEEIRKSLPELPAEKKARFVEQYGIPDYNAAILTASWSLADYYEECVKLCGEAKMVSNWIMGDLLRELKGDDREIEECPVSPQHLASMVKMITDGMISGKIAKTVFEEMYRTGRGPEEIVHEKGLIQLTDVDEIGRIVHAVLEENPKLVQEYQGGREQLLGYFVGQVMKATKGKANPQLVNELLRKSLSKR
jgi:aspartyl-tRNA(Asn)/glutamyl-tRNA(Gln) amidotransferase subunit B